MNKFEQEVRESIDNWLEGKDPSFMSCLSQLSTLHDNEMIAFAEWVSRTTIILAHGLFYYEGKYEGKEYTTAELLTIFREENK